MKNEMIVRKLSAYAEKIIGYCEGQTYEQFCADSKLAEACVFNLGQIGELANMVDDAFAEAHPEIPWRSIYGLRNRIIHDYEGVNFLLIWQIIRDDLPALKEALNRIAETNP